LNQWKNTVTSSQDFRPFLPQWLHLLTEKVLWGIKQAKSFRWVGDSKYLREIVPRLSTRYTSRQFIVKGKQHV